MTALGKLPTEAEDHRIDPRRAFVESNRGRFEQLLADGYTVSRTVKALAEKDVVLPPRLVRESLLTEEQLRLDHERRRGPIEKTPSVGE